MTTTEAYDLVKQDQPAVICVTGKTSTGKSTFARKLHDDLGYSVVGLEQILVDIAKEHGFNESDTFQKALYAVEDSKQKLLFIETTHRLIADAMARQQPLVIEGAVSDLETFQRVLRPVAAMLFLYFHPGDQEVYIRNLTKRFMESDETFRGGLPLRFWQFIDDGEFRTFCKTKRLTDALQTSIRQYAILSQQESVHRLARLREKFPRVIVVEIQ